MLLFVIHQVNDSLSHDDIKLELLVAELIINELAKLMKQIHVSLLFVFSQLVLIVYQSALSHDFRCQVDHVRKDLARDVLWLTHSPASNVTGQFTEALVLGRVTLVYNHSSLYLLLRVENLIIKLAEVRVIFDPHIVVAF